MRNQRYFFFALLFFIFIDYANAQYFGRRGRRNQLVFGLGTSNIFSDLGGRNKIGTHVSPVDLEFSETRPCGYIGIRHTFTNYFKLKGDFAYLRVNGSDKLTKEPARENRNLQFRSPVIEFSVKAEYYLFTEHNGHIYHLSGVRGMHGFHVNVYVFAGFGAAWFNPRGKLNGKWYSLQPFGTEGQGLGNGHKYSRITPIIPMGIGLKYDLNRNWSFNLEACFRKTFTDYMDDVSGNYFDNNKILEARGPIAAHFADPTINLIPGGTNAGQQRGDPTNKDNYFSVTLGASYRISTMHRHRYRAKF